MGKRPGDVWVSPNGKGWVTQQNGQVLSHHRTKHAADERAREEAIRDGVDRVSQKRDGTIGSKDSYGHDPNPPKDREH